MKEKARKLINSSRFQFTIIALIIINSIILGMETSATMMQKYGPILKFLDETILAIFIAELLLRFYVHGLEFFRRPWCLFDLAIIIVALVPASQSFATLRALRILRVLRLISVVPTMRKVVEGLLWSIPGIMSVSAIMVLLFYVFAVVGTHLYGASFPQWFGTLGETMYTLFQVMTLESWSMEIVRPVMEKHPDAWAFFVLYILITTFTMLNLFIAVIVNAMDSNSSEEAQESRLEIKKDIEDQIKSLETKLLKEIRGKGK